MKFCKEKIRFYSALVVILLGYSNVYGQVLLGERVDNSMGMEVRTEVYPELDSVYIKLVGPSDKWFAFGFGKSFMNGSYIIAYDNGNITERRLNSRNEGVLLANSLSIVSNSISAGKRTIECHRKIEGISASHYTFPIEEGAFSIIYAFGNDISLNERHSRRAISTLNLELDCGTPPETVLDSLSICEGDSIEIFGVFRSIAGDYSKTFSDVKGCDSTVVQPLYVLAKNRTILNDIEICEGQSVEIFGETQNETGEYSKIYTSVNGCDSTVIQPLQVNPIYNLTNPIIRICEGDSILVFGQYVSEPGSYSTTIKTTKGCDSTIIQPIEVYSTFFKSEERLICENDSVIFKGQKYFEGDRYIDSLLSSGGCDSLIEITLVSLNNTIELFNFDTMLTLISSSALSQIRWINCGNEKVLEGVNGDTLKPMESGFYKAKYSITQNGVSCEYETNCERISAVSVSEIAYKDLQLVFPNPSNGLVIFHNPLNLSLEVDLFNQVGHKIKSIALQRNASTELALSKGFYFIRFKINPDRAEIIQKIQVY